MAREECSWLRTVLQYSYCIAAWECRLARIVSQYNILYCDSRGSRLLDCVATLGRNTASQAMTRCRALPARRRWPGRATRRRWARARGTEANVQAARADAQASARQGRAGRRAGRRWARRRALGAARALGARHRRWARGTGAGHAAWACCWAVGCALGALSLFLTRFDSVLFLSQFLDTVHEPGS